MSLRVETRAVRVAIALGSNRGDRRAYLRSAEQRLGERADFEVLTVSRFLENPAVGGESGQGDYFNAALLGDTTLSAEALLEVLLEIEREHGRDRAAEGRCGARTLDLDLLLYGDEVIETETLTVPHPRMHERAFVLLPLAEVAPELSIPTLGETVARAAQRLLDHDSSLASTPGAAAP